jgi:serine/threonine-protein kinase
MSDAPHRLSAALADRYRIERELGEGGMATVYLAEDLKHDRRVAIKVLKPELAAVIGAERFLAEIKTTANLQHPHILPLFDSGEADGSLFYVMPYLDGESLRDRLDRERHLPVDEAVELVAKVAGAIQAAHDRGVIHRDIKPENVLLGERGEPLVADFGIALAVSQAGGGRLTETGLSLGTPYYMSPEQASADREPGPQSDVYSLGCLLYEMLAGDPPHTGSSAQAVLAKVLTERPRPVTELRETVPRHVDHALRTALQRLPADRFASADAFVRALRDPDYRVPSTPGSRPGKGDSGRAERRAWTTYLPWVIAAVLAALLWWNGLDSSTAPADAPVTRFELTTPDGQAFSAGNRPNLALDPQGAFVIYRGPAPSGSAPWMLWRRDLDQLTGRPIAGTEGGSRPRISPGGRFLAFSPENDVVVIPVDGGPPTSTEELGSSPIWGDDGAMYDRDEGSLVRWTPATGEIETIAPLPDSIADRAFFLTVARPGLALFVLQEFFAGGSVALNTRTGQWRDLGIATGVTYLDSGHLAYAREDGAVVLRPFDAETLEFQGPPRVGPDLAQRISGGGLFEVAEDGTLVYAAGGSSDLAFVWLDRAGRMEPIDWIEPTGVQGLSLSPEGRRLAVGGGATPNRPREGGDLWLYDLEARTRLRLTEDGASIRPEWHPDGDRLLFVRQAPELQFRTHPGDRPSDGELLTPVTRGPADGVWHPNGRELILRMGSDETFSRSLFRFLPGEEAAKPYLERDSDDRLPLFSPDGNWVVYVSSQSGRDEVYAQSYPEPGAVIPVSLEGGIHPRWSRSGDELFYLDEEAYLWSARVTLGPDVFEITSRERLFQLDPSIRFANERNTPIWDVAPDGRFLFNRHLEDSQRLVVVRNWVQSMRRPEGEG